MVAVLKGYTLKEDLPTESRNRDEIILDIVGRDARQIDGLGGANPLTSKVAVISVSTNPDADIDFCLFKLLWVKTE